MPARPNAASGALLRPSARGGREVEPVTVPRGRRREVPGDRRSVRENVAFRSSKGDSCGSRFHPAGMRKYRSLPEGAPNGSNRPLAEVLGSVVKVGLRPDSGRWSRNADLDV
jgi:hypothetical protein